MFEIGKTEEKGDVSLVSEMLFCIIVLKIKRNSISRVSKMMEVKEYPLRIRFHDSDDTLSGNV